MKSTHRRTFLLHVVVLEAADLSRTRAEAVACAAGRVMDEHVGDGVYSRVPSVSHRAPITASIIDAVVGEHWKHTPEITSPPKQFMSSSVATDQILSPENLSR